jgi:hypothetical protein
VEVLEEPRNLCSTLAHFFLGQILWHVIPWPVDLVSVFLLNLLSRFGVNRLTTDLTVGFTLKECRKTMSVYG